MMSNMNSDTLTEWRRQQRRQLLQAREAVDASVRADWGRAISRSLLDGFTLLAGAKLGIYWPIRAEYDPRFVAHTLRNSGAQTGLPVVVGKGQPLVFRAWQPGTEMREGGLGIPYPAASPEITLDAVLVPPVGFDEKGYRLGYGAGFFDRTLAALSPQPLAIGVAFECQRLPSIEPQPHDIALDFIVTEAAIYLTRPEGLEAISARDANAAARTLQASRRLSLTR